MTNVSCLCQLSIAEWKLLALLCQHLAAAAGSTPSSSASASPLCRQDLQRWHISMLVRREVVKKRELPWDREQADETSNMWCELSSLALTEFGKQIKSFNAGIVLEPSENLRFFFSIPNAMVVQLQPSAKGTFTLGGCYGPSKHSRHFPQVGQARCCCSTLTPLLSPANAVLHLCSQLTRPVLLQLGRSSSPWVSAVHTAIRQTTTIRAVGACLESIIEFNTKHGQQQ